MMRRLLLILVATACVGVANADVGVIDYLGYTWETGGFPPTNMGEELNIVGIADGIDAIFGVDLGTTEITFHASGLISQGALVQNGAWTIPYTGGTIEFYDDPNGGHDYGTNPPNGTSPSSFEDGTLFLHGTFTSFFLYFDPVSGAGAFEGQVEFTSGSGLPALTQLPAHAYTFGGALSATAVGPGNIPAGYDLQVDGNLHIDIVGVEQKSWTGIKNLYRH